MRFKSLPSLRHLSCAGTMMTGVAACQTAVPVEQTLSLAQADAQTCKITTPFQTTDFDADFAAHMDSLMHHMISRGLAPGAVIEIQQSGDTVFRQAYGSADLETQTPMTMDSLFRIYSMTKPITTIAALQLVDQGLMALDDPIGDYLPEFANVTVAAEDSATKGHTPARPITVRDLMRHTAGLTYRTGAKTDPVAALYAERGVPAGPGVSDPPTNGMNPVIGNESFISRLASIPLKNDPGAAFTYGNASDVLGVLVSDVSGQSLSDYLTENIFEPLEMTDTFFQLPDGRTDDFTSAYLVPPQAPSGSPIDFTVPIEDLKPQTPYRLDPFNKSLYMDAPDFEFGGAGLVSDADDYLAFTHALLHAEPPLISETLWQEATRDQLPAEARQVATFLGKRGFGLGFAVREASTQADPVFPQCGLFWAGAASTYFWIDPHTETTGVFMTQVFEGDGRSYFSEIMERTYPGPQ